MISCNRIGCLNKAYKNSLCERHYGRLSNKSMEDRRPSRKNKKVSYNSRAWRNIRMSVLGRDPICVRCKHYGKLSRAEDVDHIIPHKGNRELFVQSSNLQSLCHSCHSWKTNQEMKGKAYSWVNGVESFQIVGINA